MSFANWIGYKGWERSRPQDKCQALPSGLGLAMQEYRYEYEQQMQWEFAEASKEWEASFWKVSLSYHSHLPWVQLSVAYSIFII